MSNELISAVVQAGIVGAGGAGFPTHVKLNAKADTVIINGDSPMKLYTLFDSDDAVYTYFKANLQ